MARSRCIDASDRVRTPRTVVADPGSVVVAGGDDPVLRASRAVYMASMSCGWQVFDGVVAEVRDEVEADVVAVAADRLR